MLPATKTSLPPIYILDDPTAPLWKRRREMDKNEAKTRDDAAFRELCERLKVLVVNRDEIMANDHRFNNFLIEAVERGELKATHALYLYCARHHVHEFTLTNLDLNDGGPRTPILDFFDAIIAGEDLSGLLNVMDTGRQAGRL
jgi:hypothetical protein